MSDENRPGEKLGCASGSTDCENDKLMEAAGGSSPNTAAGAAGTGTSTFQDAPNVTFLEGNGIHEINKTLFQMPSLSSPLQRDNIEKESARCSGRKEQAITLQRTSIEDNATPELSSKDECIIRKQRDQRLGGKSDPSLIEITAAQATIATTPATVDFKHRLQDPESGIQDTQNVARLSEKETSLMCAESKRDNSTSQPQAQSTSQSAAKSTPQSAAKSTSQSAAKSTSESAAKSTPQSATKSTSQSAAKSTSQSAAKSTSESATKSTSESAAKSTSQSAAKSTSQSAAKSAALDYCLDLPDQYEIKSAAGTRLYRPNRSRTTVPKTLPSSVLSSRTFSAQSTSQSTTQSTSQSTALSTLHSTALSISQSEAQPEPLSELGQATSPTENNAPLETTSLQTPSVDDSLLSREATSQSTIQSTPQTGEATSQSTLQSTLQSGEATSQSTIQSTPQTGEATSQLTVQSTPQSDEATSQSTLQSTPQSDEATSQSTLQSTPQSGEATSLQSTPQSGEAKLQSTLQSTPQSGETTLQSTLQSTPQSDEATSQSTLQPRLQSDASRPLPSQRTCPVSASPSPSSRLHTSLSQQPHDQTHQREQSPQNASFLQPGFSGRSRAVSPPHCHPHQRQPTIAIGQFQDNLHQPQVPIPRSAPESSYLSETSARPRHGQRQERVMRIRRCCHGPAQNLFQGVRLRDRRSHEGHQRFDSRGNRFVVDLHQQAVDMGESHDLPLDTETDINLRLHDLPREIRGASNLSFRPGWRSGQWMHGSVDEERLPAGLLSILEGRLMHQLVVVCLSGRGGAGRVAVLCRMCGTRAVDVLFFPCHHRVLCRLCLLLHRLHLCPLHDCRQPIEFFWRFEE